MKIADSIFASLLFGMALLASGCATGHHATNGASNSSAPVDTPTPPETIEDKAEKGDAEAQFTLGRRYEKGDGRAQDYAGAVKWYRKAAEQGNAVAENNLGAIYYKGEGVPQDYIEALKWYQKAAEQGIAAAQSSLGWMYEKGIGVPQNYVEALKWHQKAAEQGNAASQDNLGWMYEKGVGVPQDNVEALKWYLKAAEQGNADAQDNLGICYSVGIGVPKDYESAYFWFSLAADQGATNAIGRQSNITNCMTEGQIASAQLKLGLCYCDKNSPSAVKWYRRVADQNLAKDQEGLGYFSFGTEKDLTEAVKWLRKTSDKGLAEAQYKLGRVYDLGHDYSESTKWYRRAAVQGVADAQFELGWWYYMGWGVPRNYVEAYKWCDLAAAHPPDELVGRTISAGESFRIQLRVLEERMTPEQISEAQRLAAAFVPRTETPGSDANSTSPVAADSPVATGTGFFITADGYLISNYHVVKGAAKVRLLTGAGMVDAKVAQVDAANDLALLKAEGHFAALPVASSRAVALGATVATVGFPDPGLQGFAPKLAKGEIASLSGAGDDPRYFQISVPVQPGNSGGALVDERGNVIGIVSAKLDAGVALAASGALPENVNYAVKSSLLLSFLESMPDVDAKLKVPNTADQKFEEEVKSAQNAAVLVLVY